MQDKVLLINPAVNPLSQHKIINSVINTALPTSLGALAGFLISKNISPIRIIDEQVNFIKSNDLSGIVLFLQQPRIIGLSLVTINLRRAYLLATMIKQVDPKAIVVAGGIHPTVAPEEILRCKDIDVVVRGEGEETFADLVSFILQGIDYSKIAGISLRIDDLVIHNPNRPVIANLDSLPSFPYHLFEDKQGRYSSFGSILTSRGCPHNCIFCSSKSISGKEYRYFSIERVLSEIRLLVYRYNQKTIWMMDDNIASNRVHFIKLLDAIIEADLPDDVIFHGSMRADNISEEILAKAKSANFKMIAFGMETGSESLMSLVNKGESVKQVIEAIEKTAQKGIAVATTIIFGLPAETRKDRWDTIKLVRTLPLSSVRFNILTPYPGTPVFDMLKRTNEIFIKNDWENFAVQYMWESDDLPYVPKGNNIYDLIFDTMFANLSFYLSFKGIKRMLKSSFAGGNVVRISQRWYLSLNEVLNYTRLFLYLNSRFVYITFKAIIKGLKTDKVNKYKVIKDNLYSLIHFDIDKNISTASGKCSALFSSYLKKVFENVLYEKYVELERPIYTYMPFNYKRIPAMARYKFQKLFKRNNNVTKNTFPAWPFEDSLESLREIILNRNAFTDNHLFRKLIWPGNKQYALILTHDIESANNWRWVRNIAEIEKGYGFRSSWNVVPNFYKIDYNTLDWLVENGFEIGIHDHNHDNKFAFLNEKEIHSRIKSSSDLIKQYKIEGFRSASWLRSEILFKVLQDYFVYDCSVLDADFISPAGIGGCCSVFPYKIGKIIELPTTLPYEDPIRFGITRESLNKFWAKKIQWIKKIQGAVTVVTHPDPYYGGNWPMINTYKDFLESFSRDRDIICMLPGEVAKYYEQTNSRLK